ncbi:hypothetical protein PoB_004956200 [Plakobranchus ocellatus]|uniref:Uncharacterized protein n=1 Tax=Plakobranchus ocellatus TaxID=259542 RepID=A0AAV4BVH7_9GAST|nr:hypothetical protein PoB_004956200 [Plakobranchus ocellatus]
MNTNSDKGRRRHSGQRVRPEICSTLLSRVRASPPAPWSDGGPESLISPSCGLAIRKYQIKCRHIHTHKQRRTDSNATGILTSGLSQSRNCRHGM